MATRGLWFRCDDGALFIEDRKSTNGTAVAGRTIIEPARVASGDSFEIAGFGFLLYVLPPEEIATLSRALERIAALRCAPVGSLPQPDNGPDNPEVPIDVFSITFVFNRG